MVPNDDRSTLDVVFEDISPFDQLKAEDALDRFELREVRDPDSAEFDVAYEMLASFFLPRGELEARAVLADFVKQRMLSYDEDVIGIYHLITAWDGNQLAGVRDCYIDIVQSLNICLITLSHAFVAPPWRRTGLASLFRALPLTLARHALREQLGRTLPMMMIAEMDPADPEHPETIVRLIAYGRSGFSVLDPRRVRYSQPELREIPNARHTALPMLGVVRSVGLDALTVDAVSLFPKLFHTTHRMYLPEARVAPSEIHAFASLHASSDPVPTLPLPTGADSLHHLRPLVRGAILPLYPPTLRGPQPYFGDPDREFEQIASDWIDPKTEVP